jgi:peroxiredoxin Q/BCP
MLAVGNLAPAFALEDQDGNVVRLEDLRGKRNVVLVFYPGDNTPVCTKQLCAIRDDFTDFEKLDVAVFGINAQSAKSHKKFVEKQHFPFPLLVDSDKKVVTAYGTKGLLTKRTVYGIDKDGRIVFAQRGLPGTDGVLAAFQTKMAK